MILLRDPDCPPNCAQHPHVLKYIPVFPRRLTATEGRSLQIPMEKGLMAETNSMQRVAVVALV
jgi:hypothetical protein